MSGRIIDEASLALPLLGQWLDVNGIIARPELANAIHGAVAAFVEAIEAVKVDSAD